MSKNLHYIKEVLFLLGKDKKKLPGMILLFLMLSLLDLASISIIIPYISLIISPEHFLNSDIVKNLLDLTSLDFKFEAVLPYVSVLLLLIFIIKAIVGILINRKILTFCFNQGVIMRALLMRAYQNLPYEEYVQRNSSEYVYSIEHLSAQYSQTVLQSFLRLMSEVVVVTAILVLLAFNSVLALALLTALFGISVFVYDYFFKDKVSKYGENANNQSTKIVRGVHEGIEALKEVRILGKEDFFYQKVYQGAKCFAVSTVNAQTISQSPRYLLDMLMIAFIVLFVLILSDKNEGELLLPMLGMFGVAAMRIAPSVNQIIASLSHLRFGRHGVHLLYKDVKKIKLSNNIETSLDYSSSENFRSLEFKNVSFKYADTKENIIKKLSFKIKSGDLIGIIGASGSGKTTLIDLLLGLLDPIEGDILYNNYKLKDAYPQYLSQVAYLPQQVFMSDESLISNVALGTNINDIDIERVNIALNKANLSDVVKKLPQGVDTIIGERGIRLSGGQRQRVALARAFYYDRDVLVLDESTSALDNDTEEEIINEIQEFKGRKTMIVIAHRLTTLQHCDQIYKLEDGCIVGHGSYNKMIKGQ